MKLVQVRGNTWYLEGAELIPLYRLDSRRCVLLDSGLHTEREALDAALDGNGLLPVGVFASHAHRDHIGNIFHLRERYGARLCLPEGEAAMCRSALMYKSVYDTLSLQRTQRDFSVLLGEVDETVGRGDGVYRFCGAPFRVLHTPGHTPDHIAAITPDEVCYVGDALMAGTDLARAKLPYHISYQVALESMERIKATRCAAYLAAGAGVVTDIGSLVAQNRLLIEGCAQDIRALVDGPLTQGEIVRRVLNAKKLLTSHEDKAARYACTITYFLEYLADLGRIAVTVKDGIRYYQQA